MYLINYIIKAMNPKILILKDNDRIKKVLQLTNIKNFDRSITNKYMIYDLIIDDNFNQELYANNLNYDGFYIFLNRGTNNLNNYEFLSYHNYYIIKKSEFIPYYLLEDNKKQIKNDPIIFRNFKNNFNIAPYIKPYEIINHPEIILNLCKEYSIKSYLELGIRNSIIPSLIKDIVPCIVGVDIINIKKFDGIFNCMTTNNFFKINKIKFDMIFIDANHEFEYVREDFINSLNCVNDNGIILLHDTYPVNELMTNKQLCNNCYLMINYIKRNYIFLELLNIPISPGLCIVKKNNNSSFDYPNFDNYVIPFDKYSIMICVREKQMAIPVLESLKPLHADILIGEGYPSFSKLVNDAIIKAKEEIVIFCSHRVRPTAKEVEKIIYLLKQGYGLSSS